MLIKNLKSFYSRCINLKIKVKKNQSKLEIFNFCFSWSKIFNSVFSMKIFLKPNINQIDFN